MALGKLGSSLYEALRKVLRAPVLDETIVKELCNDVLRALLQADVNVRLALDLSKRVEARVLREAVPPGISRKEHVIKVVYEEITRLLGGEAQPPYVLKPGKLNVLLFVGIQGSGKTTTAVKVANFYRKRGFKVALVCTDTYRPGAYEQLQQLASSADIQVYGDPSGRDPVRIAINALRKLEAEGYELAIIDTAGRHKEEGALMKEMKSIAEAIKPDEISLIIDGTIGQQAFTQAKAFDEATKIGSIIITKLDGTAKGGGALSAVAATGAKIRFIGIGEKIGDIEAFSPTSFVGRLLGMGDLKGLIEKAKEAEVSISEERAKAIFSGRLTLKDLYEQIEAIGKMGPLDRILSMLPGLSYKVPEDFSDVAKERFDKWKAIIQSMTEEEKENPKVLNASRIRRIARGAGVREGDVKEMLKYFDGMKRVMKAMKGRGITSFRRLMKMASQGGLA
ncbi:signal recognition particle protein Srp54 [Candidatus Bathyarchaeota archaeon]|nr:signal recognition particle protein Srp54 [Candidatus Bathyarchaeota archaeon]MBS7628119.1 signal recognition particle protein Srp54 [Candidatus Bathyarchaeota archaeon]